MTPKSVSIEAPFKWFGKTFTACRANPKAIFGALAMLTGIIMVIGVVQSSAQYLYTSSPQIAVAIYVLTTLIGWVLFPPLMAGIFCVMDRSERGQPVAAGHMLKVWQDGGLTLKVVLTAAAYMGVYLALVGIVMMLPSGEFYREYFAIALSVPPGGEPDTAAILDLFGRAPADLIPVTLLFMVAATAWAHAYMLALVTAALAPASAVQSMVAGVSATVRNALPLLLATLAIVIVGFTLSFVVALVLILVGAVLALLSPAIALVVLIPALIALMVVLYALMFGFYYHGWREMFPDAAAAPTLAHTVAL